MTAATGSSALIIGASRGLGYMPATVNAGVTSGPEETVADMSAETFVRLMVTNALSPMRVVEALQDLVAPDGTIGVMSSGQGSVANNDKGGFEIYRASKSALKQLMRSFAARHVGDPRTLLLMAPRLGADRPWRAAAPLTIGQSIPGEADTIQARPARADCSTWTTGARPSAGSARGPHPKT